MKALTLKQPWAWAVAHAGKDVENRSWKPPASVIGRRIAIHAGKAFDGESDIVMCRYCTEYPDPPDMAYGAIVAVAKVAGWVSGDGEFCLMPGVDTILPLASSMSRWFFGYYGWMLTDVMALPEPIPCKGAQGLWNVPPEIEAEINKQVNP